MICPEKESHHKGTNDLEYRSVRIGIKVLRPILGIIYHPCVFRDLWIHLVLKVFKTRMHIAIHLIIYAILIGLNIGGVVLLVISMMGYRKLISTESSKCPVFSCGADKSTTAPVCQGTEDTNPNGPPYYAYRTNTAGTTECQSSRALDRVQLVGAP